MTLRRAGGRGMGESVPPPTILNGGSMKLKPSTRRVLCMLQTHQPHGVSAKVLLQPECGGARYGARIGELRKLGYVISSYRMRNRPYNIYILESEPMEISA